MFAGGAPTQLYRGAFDFCCNLIAEEAETTDFVNVLQALQLLAPRTVNMRITSGGNVQQSFLTIDEAALRALSAEDFLELRRKGWLTAIFAQLQSTLNWHKISDLQAHVSAQAGPRRIEHGA